MCLQRTSKRNTEWTTKVAATTKNIKKKIINSVQLLFVCYVFVWAGWSFGSYSADVDLLYPLTHILTEDSHNTRNFLPYSSRIVCGFFNVPQGTNEHGRYLWDGAYGF